MIQAVGQIEVSPQDQLQMYRSMLRIRLLDERMLTLQRQGRIGFYGACTGQEAAAVAPALALEPEDWVFPALREGAAMLARGYPLVPYLSQLFGNTGDPSLGRQMPSHQASRTVNQVSWSSVIGTQLPHAVGAAMAARLRREPRVVLAFLGDGATSTGDFHAAMTFAGLFKAPVVFVCQNNGWAISLPSSRQTASESLAAKAEAYGLGGIQVDGNDASALLRACRAAAARARKGCGATFLEAITYRLGGHSSSDDPTRYRDPAEVERWRARDPIARLRAELEAGGNWDQRREQALAREIEGELVSALNQAEFQAKPSADTLVADVYSALPWHLREQREELLGPR